MTELPQPPAVEKAVWTPPEIVDLDLTMAHIENGLQPGIDGAGGSNTSHS